MTDQPVTPDREALIRTLRTVEHFDGSRLGPIACGDLADALLPLIADAVDQAEKRGEQRGRNKAAEAIEASAEGKFVRVKDYCYRWADDDEPDSGCGETPCPGHDNGDGHFVTYGREHFAALARGADRKAADAPWDTALDVDPPTGQPDQHEHGDACEGGCE